MVQLTLDGGKADVRCTCFKVCKQNRGLRIDQARNRFGFVKTQTQSTEPTGEMQEDPNQDTTHRVGNLSVSESSQDSNGDSM